MMTLKNEVIKREREEAWNRFESIVEKITDSTIIQIWTNCNPNHKKSMKGIYEVFLKFPSRPVYLSELNSSTGFCFNTLHRQISFLKAAGLVKIAGEQISEKGITVYKKQVVPHDEVIPAIIKAWCGEIEKKEKPKENKM